ncbi:uncharacterized protein P884DRAFT_265409 [Thermothelomyces heterothallicus CBS 202.75]|uniref:uncharacterized protein n=1 Tax=Thermothelomyces heterothallicus CBS 202.75 TaxID=1149848 RepID=UPI003742E1BE
MRLSGETVVGQYAGEHEFDDDSGERDDSATSLFLINRPEHPPKTLVYRTEANWPRACIFFLVAYSEQGLRRTTERPWHSPPPHPYPFWYRHSHAPLGEVRQVRVFYRPDTKTCMGMLLDYDNGGQRAVGQCRLHVDPSRTFPRPSFVAFLNLPEYGEGVRVLFGDLPSLDEDEHGDSWCYFAMAGTLDFWFGPDAAAVSVREGKPIPWETLLKKHG